MSAPPEILATERLFTGRRNAIDAIDIAFATGQRRTFECIRSRLAGAVMVVAVDGDDVLLIREYQAGTGRYEWVLPKGAMDPGESVLDAGRRELREETGFDARELRALKPLAVAPAMMDAVSNIVLAQGLFPAPLDSGDEPEPMALVRWPLREWHTLVERAEFHESRSLAAIALVDRLLHAGPR